MTAGTATVEETPSSTWPGILGKTLYLILVLTVAFILYKGLYNPQDPGNNLWWQLGTGWLLLAGLVFVLFMLAPERRRLGLFVFINLALAVLIGAYIQDQLTGNPSVVQAVQDNGLLNFLLGGVAESIFWSIVLGLIGALLLIGLPLLVISAASALYVLALHEVEGVSRWDAMRYVLAPILGLKLPFIVVENGQALITKKAGKIDVIGGPGKLIIKQGNVVVLERGGKISRIVNAGVVKLRPKETIRNIFVLTRQSNSKEIEHVLTKDRIPLKISMGISFHIEPAAEVDKRPESRIAPDGEALTTKLDDGLLQVYEGTIRKAVLMSQATSFAQRQIEKCQGQTCQDVEETTWQKVAGGVPENELRDHIMSHRFDELFELVDSAPGEKPEARVKKRKIYEIEQAILEEIKPGRAKGLGVFVRGVDIGKIEFPVGAEQLLLNRWGAPWTQQIGLIEAETKAHGSLQARMLEAGGNLEAKRLEAQGELDIAELKAQAILINARAEAQKEIMKGRSKAEAQAAFFRFILQTLQIDGRPMDTDVIKAVLQQLARAFASVNDLETFVRVQGDLSRRGISMPRPIGHNGSDDVDGDSRE